MRNSEIDSFNKYFNNAVTQQVGKNEVNNANKKKTEEEQNNTVTNKANVPVNESPLISNLSSLLDTAQNVDNLDSQITGILYKIIDSGANPDNLLNLLDSLTGDTDDILYTRTNNDDPFINSENNFKLIGGDLEHFLAQSVKVSDSGNDINHYINTVSSIVSRGDYDDLRNFLEISDNVLNASYDFDKYLDHINYTAEFESENIEHNLFSLFVLLDKGASMDEALTILDNMVTEGRNGKSNLSLLDTVLIEGDKEGFFTPFMIAKMAESGDTKAFIDEWLNQNGFEIINQLVHPDFEHVESINESNDLVINKGDKTALFAQAVSSTEGALPGSVLYWSSLQTGSMTNGSGYCDLSQLEEGVYDIYVKVGPGQADTDTAKRRVVVMPEGTKREKEKNNNGLGDMKDSDNTVKGVDESNPGKKKKNIVTDNEKIRNLVSEVNDSRTVYQDIYQSLPPDLFAMVINDAEDYLSQNFSKSEENDAIIKVLDYLERQSELMELAQEEFSKLLMKEILEKYYAKKEITEKDIFDVLKDQDFKRFLMLIKNNLIDKDPATATAIQKFE